MGSLKKLSLLFVCTIIFYSFSYAQSTPPDPLRFEEDIASFNQWDRKNSFPKDPILFVGSSSIVHWETSAAFPKLPIINRGFGGSVISDIQYYYDQVIDRYKPRVIVFYAGDNDVAGGIPVKGVFNNYKEIVERIIKDHSGVRFLYVPIKPSSSRWDVWDSMKEVNQRIKEYNEQNDQLYYIDLATPLLNANGKPDDSFFLDDQLHLSKKGYSVWNRIMYPRLKEIYSQ